MLGAESPGNAHLFVIFLALGLLFDFVRGFHEPACVLSPVIYTRALSLGWAVLSAGILTLALTFLLPLHPPTIMVGIIDPAVSTHAVLASGLLAAIAWNLVSWGLRLPAVTSHALIGGLLGAGLAAGGPEKVRWIALGRPLLQLVLSFSLCLGIGALLARCFPRSRSARSPSSSAAKIFRILLLAPAGLHFLLNEGAAGTRTTAVFVLLLVTEGYIDPRSTPISFLSAEASWIFSIAALGISATYLGALTGGRRIIRTLGSRITRLRPVDGFVATMTSFTFLLFGRLPIPVATTPSVAGAIAGAGTVRGRSAVRWSVPISMGLAWVLAIPVAGVFGFVCHQGFRVLFASLGQPR
jgi:inorganic phosphate transporter, PiT family